MSIEIREHDPSWATLFAEEAERLRRALGRTALRIAHVGSTSVPGLAAKPVIDIQVSVASLEPAEPYRSALAELGYTLTGEPFPYFHKPSGWPHTHHVHVREAGSRDEARTLAFRDFLRRHPADRRRYEQLKRELAEGAEDDTPQGRFRYSEAKTDFIQAIERHVLDSGECGCAGVEVRESPIEGLGLFADRGYEEGERIRSMVFVRKVSDDEPLRPDRGERFDHCAFPDGRMILVGYPDRHLNHSCDPNAWEQFDGERVHVVARRRVEPGEELTVDYAINASGGHSWPCRCGAARCRGETVGDFFELPDAIRAEYLPLLAPWFSRRHASLLGAVRSSSAR